MINPTSLVATLSLVLFVDTVSIADDQAELLAACRDGYLQARSSIRSLTCTAEVKTSSERAINPVTGKMTDFPASTLRLDWLQVGDVASAKLRSDDNSIQYYSWRNGVLKHLVEKQGKERSQAYGRIDGAKGIRQVMTVWQLALMPQQEAFLEEIDGGNVRVVDRVALQNAQCIRLSVYKNEWRKDFWFDVKKNFLIRRIVFYPAADAAPPNHFYEVTDFTEHLPGVFFPAAVKETGATTTFKDVHINESVEDSQLEIRFPPGTKVTDTRKGTYYTVGDNEEPVGSVESVVTSGTGLPTALEPSRSYVVYWVGAVVGVIVLLAAALLRRRAVAARQP
jgi:hypothetical protein